MNRRIEKLLSVRRRRAQVARARLRASEHRLAEQRGTTQGSAADLASAFAAGTTACRLQSLAQMHASHLEHTEREAFAVGIAMNGYQNAAAAEQRAERLAEAEKKASDREAAKREQRELDDLQGGRR